MNSDSSVILTGEVESRENDFAASLKAELVFSVEYHLIDIRPELF